MASGVLSNVAGRTVEYGREIDQSQRAYYLRGTKSEKKAFDKI